MEENLEEQGSKPLCETLHDFDSVIENLDAEFKEGGVLVSFFLIE